MNNSKLKDRKNKNGEKNYTAEGKHKETLMNRYKNSKMYIGQTVFTISERHTMV